MSKVSFSTYLVHFAILDLIRAFPALFHMQVIGVDAIAAFAFGWVVTVPIVYVVSWCSYQAIEQPMIAVGKSLIRWNRAPVVRAPLAADDRTS